MANDYRRINSTTHISINIFMSGSEFFSWLIVAKNVTDRANQFFTCIDCCFHNSIFSVRRFLTYIRRNHLCQRQELGVPTPSWLVEVSEQSPLKLQTMFDLILFYWKHLYLSELHLFDHCY